MACCLQKTVSRLPNSIFLHGRGLTNLVLDVKNQMHQPLNPQLNNVFKVPSNGSNLLTQCQSTPVSCLDSKLFKFQPSSPCKQEAKQTNYSEMSEDRQQTPQEEHLTNIFTVLSNDLPKFFADPSNYKIYRTDIILENNIRGIRTVGIYPYIKEASKLRIWGHLNFAYVKLEVLKITKHTEDSTIKVRWRVVGTAGTRIIFTFWRYKLWELKKILSEPSSWLDGFSTFYVGQDGKVFKHTVDKVIPDQNRTPNILANIAGAKALLFVGLSSEISPILGC